MEIIGRVLETLGGSIKKEVDLHLNSDMEAQSLKNNLENIQKVLEDAEQRQLKEPSIKAWLEELRDKAYDVEDALDDSVAANRALQQELAEEANRTASIYASLSWDKLCLNLHGLCSCFNKVVERRSVALDIKGLNQSIEEMYKRGVDQLNLNQLFRTSSTTKNVNESEYNSKWRKTTSDLIKSRVHGRESDVENIKKMLLPDKMDSDSANVIEVVSIVGQGGLGKTTVARMIYNDDDVKCEFKVRMWVCVSHPFDEFSIVKEIYEQLNRPSPNKVSSLEVLKREIKDSLGEKTSKFLLVLDDVWTEDPKEWEPLEACLSHGAKGSKILMTTRNENTVVALGGIKNAYYLRKMDNEICWRIIRQTALLGNEGGYPGLESIGRKIAEKCDGLPLAAQTLGGSLMGKRSVRDWRRVFESEIWELKDVENKLFRHFFLSYDQLEPAAKRCFSYCAVFPKDYRMDVEDLIRIWMAQGFLSSSNGDDMEMLGHKHLKDLAQRSFLQVFVEDDFSMMKRVSYCTMHDIVHDFAQYLSRNECAAVKGVYGNGNRKSGITPPHHLSWTCDYDNLATASIASDSTIVDILEKLRSLLGSKGLPVNTIHRVKSIRALGLVDCDLVEIPEETGNLIHLRYLNLSRNYDTKELPESICNLFNLQTLVLSRCTRFSRLPQGIYKLTNLRHLVLDDYIQYPPGIAKLTNLLTLNRFRVGEDWNNLRYLKDLNQLEGKVEIILQGLEHEESDGGVEAANIAALEQKKGIHTLFLQYYDTVRSQVVETLRPHSELERLCIRLTNNSVLPGWISGLENLMELIIVLGPGALPVDHSSFPPLWNFQSLERLEIAGQWMGEYLGNAFYGLVSTAVADENKKQQLHTIAFPSLKELSLKCDRRWRGKWDEMSQEEEAEIRRNNIKVMPRLTKLVIEECDYLEILPCRALLELPSLRTLNIENCRRLKTKYGSCGIHGIQHVVFN